MRIAFASLRARPPPTSTQSPHPIEHRLYLTLLASLLAARSPGSSAPDGAAYRSARSADSGAPAPVAISAIGVRGIEPRVVIVQANFDSLPSRRSVEHPSARATTGAARTVSVSVHRRLGDHGVRSGRSPDNGERRLRIQRAMNYTSGMLENDLRDFADLKTLHAALRSLPSTVSPLLVVDALVHLFTLNDTSLSVLATTLKKQTPAHLALLAPRLEHVRSTRVLFVREYLRVAGEGSWPAVIDVLMLITKVGRDAAGRRTAQTLAADPAAAAACAALVRGWPGDWLVETVAAVLVYVEGDLGFDALAPHVERMGITDLEFIEKWALEGSPIRVLVQERQSARRSRSKAVAWARAIGLDVEAFHFHLELEAEQGGGFLIDLTDTYDPWFQCELVRHDRSLPEYRWPTTRLGLFGGADGLSVGIPNVDDVGPWFRAASQKLGLTWKWHAAHVRTSVRGKARSQLLAYFRGSER